MKPYAAAILAVLALSALQGCARNFSAELGPAGLDRIRAEAEALWNRHASDGAASARGVELAADAWPGSIAAINPEALQVRRDGVYIIVASGFLNAQILFVPCPTCAALSLKDARANIRGIAPRVYDLSATL